ncbi:MAG: hypothetical protein QME94_14365, partial [Anaerolineae bacterium]|nr:hypothetical protein [Anaerolineae bacterium]
IALQALFEAYQASAGQNACDLRKEMPFLILSRANAEERLQLAAWTRQALTRADPAAAEDYWRFLLDVEALDPGSCRAIFDQCRAAGYADVVAEKLLDLDRVGEALTLARKELRDPQRLLRFASSPSACAQAPAVTALVEERLSRG